MAPRHQGELQNSVEDVGIVVPHVTLWKARQTCGKSATARFAQGKYVSVSRETKRDVPLFRWRPKRNAPDPDVDRGRFYHFELNFSDQDGK